MGRNPQNALCVELDQTTAAARLLLAVRDSMKKPGITKSQSVEGRMCANVNYTEHPKKSASDVEERMKRSVETALPEELEEASQVWKPVPPVPYTRPLHTEAQL